MQSSDDPNATRPNRLTRPYPGFTPTTPQNAAGWRTDPPVSEPSAAGVTPAATSAAEPPLDPPGTQVGVERVVDAAERGVFRRRAHRELVEIGLRGNQCTSRAQAGDGGGFVG